MRFQEASSSEAPLAMLVLSREEAVQVVKDLIDQLADTPGAGSKAHICRSETDPRWARRLVIVLG
jgi:hypothetical protein